MTDDTPRREPDPVPPCGPAPQADSRAEPLRGAVPVLETARLRMRGHRLADLAACAAMWADPVVVRFITGKPSTAQQSWMRLLGYVGHWAVQGFGYWVVEERATGRFVGEVGFADWRRELEPPLAAGVPELGWVLASQAHGQGYATEAVRAACAWGDRRLGAARTVCIIDPEHARSLRVAARCGFREVGRVTLAGAPTILLAREPGLVADDEVGGRT